MNMKTFGSSGGRSAARQGVGLRRKNWDQNETITADSASCCTSLLSNSSCDFTTQMFFWNCETLQGGASLPQIFVTYRISSERRDVSRERVQQVSRQEALNTQTLRELPSCLSGWGKKKNLSTNQKTSVKLRILNGRHQVSISDIYPTNQPTKRSLKQFPSGSTTPAQKHILYCVKKCK